MTKSDLIKVVSKRAHLTKKASCDAIETMFEEITRSLTKGNKVVISGFGTFYLSQVKDKEVVPFGNESKRQTVRKHKVVNFRVGKPLKKSVW